MSSSNSSSFQSDKKTLKELEKTIAESNHLIAAPKIHAHYKDDFITCLTLDRCGLIYIPELIFLLKSAQQIRDVSKSSLEFVKNEMEAQFLNESQK